MSDWSGAAVDNFYRPVKQQVTLRIDAEIRALLDKKASDREGNSVRAPNKVGPPMIKKLASDRVALVRHNRAMNIVRAAEDLLNDADILSGSGCNLSNADALLDVLAFELMLKCVVYIEAGKDQRSHDYCHLWSILAPEIQSSLLDDARKRVGIHADYQGFDAKLRDWQVVFTRGRYYFEFYVDMTFEEQADEGMRWIDAGAPFKDAKVRYWPRELRGLNEALLAHLRRWLARHAS